MTAVIVRVDSRQVARHPALARGRMRPHPAGGGSRDSMARSEIREERLIAALRSTPMFRGLSPAELARLQAIAALRDYDRGETLWSAGDAAEAFTLIVRGRVKIVRHGAGGDVILEIFDVGEPVGAIRSEERRVGKGCRSGVGAYDSR